MNGFRRQILINLSIILGSPIIFGALFYWSVSNLDFQAQKIAADRDLLNRRTGLINSLADFKRISPKIDAYQKAMDGLLPPKDSLVDLNAFLDGLARADNVNINFSFQGNSVPSNDNQAGRIAFNLNVSGKYDDIENFLNDTENKNTKFLLSLDGFEIVRNENDNYSINLQGSAFFK